MVNILPLLTLIGILKCQVNLVVMTMITQMSRRSWSKAKKLFWIGEGVNQILFISHARRARYLKNRSHFLVGDSIVRDVQLGKDVEILK